MPVVGGGGWSFAGTRTQRDVVRFGGGSRYYTESKVIVVSIKPLLASSRLRRAALYLLVDEAVRDL